MKRGNLTLVVVCACAVAWSAPAGAAEVRGYGVWDVTFYDAGESNGLLAGEGSWTEEQMSAVGAAVQVWQTRIGNVPGRQLQMHAFWSELDSLGTSVLGGSGSYRVTDGNTTWGLAEYVYREQDNPGYTSYGFDTILQYDITCAGWQWYFGAGTPTANQVDFRSVVAHEVGHSLGWETTYDHTADDWGWFGDTYGYTGLTAWDRNLRDAQGNRAISGGFGTPRNFNELGNPVYWDGPAAKALYGRDVPIYAPNPWQDGSSLSHLDWRNFPGEVMAPYISNGQVRRTPSELEWAMMQDMGWTIVPEPATICLLSGAGLTLLRRRR